MTSEKIDAAVAEVGAKTADSPVVRAPVPAAGKTSPRRRGCKKPLVVPAANPDQLDMLALLELQYLVELAAAPTAEDDDPLAAVPIIQRLVSAAAAAPIAPMGPVSVFDLWRAPLAPAPRRAQEAAKVIIRVERTAGAVRCTRILPSETAEWQERERVRRAKQTPPKPVKAAKTMGEKMRAALGSGRP